MAAGVAGAQEIDEWTTLNPLPAVNRLNAVAFGADRYVAVGEVAFSS